MSTTHLVSREFLKKMLLKEIDIEGDEFVVCLMSPGFSFNPAAPTYYDDIEENEIATGNGYTRKTAVIANMSVDEDNGDILVNGDNVTVTADGGSIPETGGACIVWDTPMADGDKLVCSYIHFGGANYSTGDGNIFQINFATNGVYRGEPNPS